MPDSLDKAPPPPDAVPGPDETRPRARSIDPGAADRLEAFTYAVSHDLGAPLRAIAVSLDLIEKRHAGAIGAEGGQLMRLAIQGARRMQMMIDGLVELSRLRKHHDAAECVRLGDVVTSAIGAHASEIAATGAAIDVDPLPAIAGDAAQLTRLFGELIGNALKFAHPDAPPRIAIRASVDRQYLLVRVCDNGIGVPEQRLARLFEPFQRLFHADAYPGLGLGLTRCREIAEIHRGFIDAASNPGPDHGLTVTIGLPLPEGGNGGEVPE